MVALISRERAALRQRGQDKGATPHERPSPESVDISRDRQVQRQSMTNARQAAQPHECWAAGAIRLYKKSSTFLERLTDASSSAGSTLGATLLRPKTLRAPWESSAGDAGA